MKMGSRRSIICGLLCWQGCTPSLLTRAVVHAYRELSKLAASVVDNFIRIDRDGWSANLLAFSDALPGANVLSFRGVLNSTTNAS